MTLTPLIHQHRSEIALEAARKGKAQLDTAKDELCRNEGAMATLSSAYEVVKSKRSQLLAEPPAEPPTVDAALGDVEKMLSGLVEAAATNIVHTRGRVRGAEEAVEFCKALYATEQEAMRALHAQLYIAPTPPEPAPEPPSSEDATIPQASRKRLAQEEERAASATPAKVASRRPRKVGRK